MNSRFIFLLLFQLIVIKIGIIIFISIYGNNLFGSNSDANYYNAYALGYTDIATSIWPIILRFLNNIEIYSRNSITFFNQITAIIIIPLIVAYFSRYKKNLVINKKTFWLIFIYINIYPTLFFFSLDIYRDVFMTLVFLIGVSFLEILYDPYKNKSKLFALIFSLLIAYFLFSLRLYLGFSYLIAIILPVFLKFNKIKIFSNFIIYLFILNVIYSAGFFEPLINYRENFLENDGGSTLRIIFNSPITFIPTFLKSLLFQLFGLYITNTSALFVFVIESIPFILALIYVIKNIKYSNKFIESLLIFFVVYSTIWLIGNDNLGTAARLRIPSYLSIYIAFIFIHKNKNRYLSSNKYYQKL